MYPGVSFYTMSTSMSPPATVRANTAFTTARTYEGRYVAGVVAATVMRTGRAALVSLLDVTPEIAARANAFILGAQAAVAAGLSPLAAGANVTISVCVTPATVNDANEAYAAQLLISGGAEGTCRSGWVAGGTEIICWVHHWSLRVGVATAQPNTRARARERAYARRHIPCCSTRQQRRQPRRADRVCRCGAVRGRLLGGCVPT